MKNLFFVLLVSVLSIQANAKLNIGILTPANPEVPNILGSKIHVTKQDYGLTINGYTLYGNPGARVAWYAVVQEDSANGTYTAKGKLQVQYVLESATNNGGFYCEYDIQVKLTEADNGHFYMSYQFPVAVANYVKIPKASCPQINTDTTWKSDIDYFLSE